MSATASPRALRVTVRAGEQTDVTPQFTSKGMGITGLEVVPIPDEASLWLDGKPLTPRATNVVTPGPHLLEARARAWLEGGFIEEVRSLLDGRRGGL